MGLTAAQVLELAPDAGSRKAGQDLGRAAKWQGLGRRLGTVWGEIKGSGSAPYRVVADPAASASKCSCPSRKFPCKHALGLMLVDAASPDALPEGDLPEWAEAWTRGRAARAAGPGPADPGAPAKPVDEKAQAKRRQAREGRVAEALDELDLWLADLLRRGLAAAKSEPYPFWDRMAARLVDNQAAGLARRVRALPGIAAGGGSGGSGGLEPLAVAVGRLGLLVRAARRLDRLDPEAAAGVRAAVGFPVGAEELAARPGVADRWAVLAHTTEEGDRLVERSVWLAGRDTGRLARLLDFGAPGAPLPPAPVAGQDFAGELAFHPGAPPLRALLRGGAAGPSPAGPMPGAVDVAAALAGWAAALAAAPWTERWPLRLGGVRLGFLPGEDGDGRPLGAGDATGCLPLRRDHRSRALAAVARGGPVDLLCFYDGAALSPIAAAAGGRLYVAPADSPRPYLRRVA